MEFSRQEHRSRLSCFPPGDLPDPGIKPISCIAGRFFTVWATREAQHSRYCHVKWDEIRDTKPCCQSSLIKHFLEGLLWSSQLHPPCSLSPKSSPLHSHPHQSSSFFIKKWSSFTIERLFFVFLQIKVVSQRLVFIWSLSLSLLWTTPLNGPLL